MNPDLTDYEKLVVAAMKRKMSWWACHGNDVLVLVVAGGLYTIGFVVESRALEILASTLPALQLIRKMAGPDGLTTMRSVVEEYEAAMEAEEKAENPSAKSRTQTE